MKFILKILFAPIVAILAIIAWVCGLTLSMSAWVFGIIGTILGILGLAVLLLDSVTNGIIILVIAYLVSPVGLPMMAAWMIGQLQKLRYFMQSAVYGLDVTSVQPGQKWNRTGVASAAPVFFCFRR